MKIAICISGQPRTWDKCYPSWEKFIQKLNDHFSATTDIFCHAWDFNTPPHAVLAIDKLGNNHLVSDFLRVKGQLIDDKEKDTLIQQLKPVSYLFESEEVSKKKTKDLHVQSIKYVNEHGNISIQFAGSQFYGVMRAAHLKKKHELENGFKYDMCIRLRYDLYLNDDQINWFFNPRSGDANIPKYNTFYSCHTGKDGNQFPFHRLGDVFWYADSVTFDRICDFYRWIPMIGTRSFNKQYQIGTEHALYFYAKMLRMNIHALSFDPKVYRQSEYLEQKQQAGLAPELGSHELI